MASARLPGRNSVGFVSAKRNDIQEEVYPPGRPKQSSAAAHAPPASAAYNCINTGIPISMSTLSSMRDRLLTLMNTSEVLLRSKNGRPAGVHNPWTTTGISNAICNKKMTELYQGKQETISCDIR